MITLRSDVESRGTLPGQWRAPVGAWKNPHHKPHGSQEL